MFLYKRKITSSALGYSIAFLLLIGLICIGVLAITSVHKRLEHIYAVKDHLIFDNYLALSTQDSDTATVLHPSGDTSFVTNKKWGNYNLTHVLTRNKGLSLSSSALKGRLHLEKLPALYLLNRNAPLLLAGSALVEGDAYLSDLKIASGTISSKPFQSKSYLSKGNVYTTQPNFNIQRFDANLVEKITQGSNSDLSYLPQDSVFAFATKTTRYTSSQSINVSGDLKGNLIIQSFDKIIVSKSSRLENIILIAPEVEFEENTHSTVQVFASKSIHLKKNVKLNYPSSLVVIGHKSIPKSIIFMEENSTLLGSIYMQSSKSNSLFDTEFRTEEHTLIGGIVYNDGISDIKGTIVGHLFTGAVSCYYQGHIYDNTLLDCKISSVDLPDFYVYPNWIKNTLNDKQKIIKRF